MLLNILLFLLSVLHSHARRVPDEHRWNIKYRLDRNGGEFDRVILSYDFDTESFEEEIPFNVCYIANSVKEVRPLHDFSGYVYCTVHNKGIIEMCPPGTEIGGCIYKGCYNKGCVNKTTNTSVFPIGSRCASQPCQNGGVCFDFRSADGYLCDCPYPYQGLHCHLLRKSIPESGFGGRVGNFSVSFEVYTNDMALDHICFCYDYNRRPVALSYAANNCYTDELFVPKCEGDPPVGALPFTNKGFYICPLDMESLFIISCALHHVWNDTQKECVLENN